MSRRDSFLFTTSSCARPLRRLPVLMTRPSEDLRSQITSGKEYSVQASCTSRIVWYTWESTKSSHSHQDDFDFIQCHGENYTQVVGVPPLLTCAFHLTYLQFQAFLERAGGFIFCKLEFQGFIFLNCSKKI